MLAHLSRSAFSRSSRVPSILLLRNVHRNVTPPPPQVDKIARVDFVRLERKLDVALGSNKVARADLVRLTKTLDVASRGQFTVHWRMIILMTVTCLGCQVLLAIALHFLDKYLGLGDLDEYIEERRRSR